MQGRPLSLQMCGYWKVGRAVHFSFTSRSSIVALPIPEVIESGTTVEAGNAVNKRICRAT